jgi:monoterpene epsilon-lactone hydrolase
MSLQAKIIKKLLLFQISNWSNDDIEAQRARLERRVRLMPIPGDISCQPVNVDGVPAEWIEAPDANLGVILYLHGGAYALGSINTHRAFIARLSHATGMRALALDYRLAPEHPYPAALEDALTAYRWLLTQGISPAQIIIAGDSAGGGLTLATMVALRDAGLPLPAGGICISPWTDMANTGESIQKNAHLDPVLRPDYLGKYAQLYTGTQPATDPLISPVYADLTSLPPLLIQVGTDEIILDDSIRFAERAKEAGVDVTLEIYDGMFHVFQMAWILPEAKKAMDSIVFFVRQYVAATSINLNACIS